MQPECQFTDGAAALQQVQLGGIRLAKANRTWAMVSRTYINALLATRSSGLTTQSTWSPRSSTNPRPDLAKNNSRLGRCYQPAQRHQGRTGTHRKERAAAVLAALEYIEGSQTQSDQRRQRWTAKLHVSRSVRRGSRASRRPLVLDPVEVVDKVAEDEEQDPVKVPHTRGCAEAHGEVNHKVAPDSAGKSRNAGDKRFEGRVHLWGPPLGQGWASQVDDVAEEMVGGHVGPQKLLHNQNGLSAPNRIKLLRPTAKRKGALTRACSESIACSAKQMNSDTS